MAVRATQTLNTPPSVCIRAHCFYANIFFKIANALVNMFTVHVTITATLSIHNYINALCGDRSTTADACEARV